MLVKLTEARRARVRSEKLHRELLKENPGRDECDKDFRKTIKWHKKAYRFQNFFKPYHPQGWEYVKDDEKVFTGVYIVRDTNQTETMVNLLSNQVFLDEYKKDGYKSGDIWFSFGLCDNASQVIKYYERQKKDGRFPGNHIIAMQPMGKGSWRWHKWGEYIGEFQHCHECFCDEVGISNVYSFEIIKVR